VKVRFLSVAARELIEAHAYYEALSPDLARRFAGEIESALARVKANPSAWAPMGSRHRRCRTNHFPFGLVYTVLDDEILIIAVSHLHRDPEHWRTRIGT
jgi:toxin ParE1/3/4